MKVSLELEKQTLRTIYRALIAKRERIISIYGACKDHNSPCFSETWWHEWVMKEIKELDAAINAIEQVLHPNELNTIKS